MTSGRAARSAGLALALGLGSCGGVAGAAMPARLATTVHRVEEQGVDFSGVGTTRFEVSLEPSGVGVATRSTRGADALGADVHETDDAVRYAVHARYEDTLLLMELTPETGSPVAAEAVALSCERWRVGARSESSELEDPSLPGVAWVCELPAGRTFALGRAVVEHVPREGAFLLLGETSGVVVREQIDGQGRRVGTAAE